MTRAMFIKQPGRLIPADADAEEMMSGIKNGVGVFVSVKEPRNYKHHQLMFVMLNKICENCLEWKDAHSLLDALKIEVGYVDRVKDLHGKIYLKPKSISFEKMDQTAFRRFYNRLVHVVCTQVIPGLDKEDLEREVNEMLADKRYEPA
jgi:hypothetical protein